MSAQGQACINRKKNSVSHLVLIDPDAGFTATTDVLNTKIVDTKNGLEWTTDVPDFNHAWTRMKIKLTCSKALVGAAGIPVDAGSLTITLTDSSGSCASGR